MIRRYDGYTLVELLVVCGILGLLMGLAGAGAHAVRRYAEKAGRKQAALIARFSRTPD